MTKAIRALQAWRLLAVVIVAACHLPVAGAVIGAESRRLPDTEVTRSGQYSAWLIAPTNRYAHGVLGDAIEAGGFTVEHAGQRLTYQLGPDAVFEDRRVRLVDLDGDGVPEAIVVKAYIARGAALVVYRIGPTRIEPLAESAAIGTPNRWLNPVGIAAFAAVGEMTIAAVITPHLSGSLRLYRLEGARLVEAARIDGYTNHIIGRRDLDLGHFADVDGDGLADAVLPTLDRRALAAVSFAGNRPRELKRWPVEGLIEKLRPDGSGEFAITTTSGVSRLRPKP